MTVGERLRKARERLQKRQQDIADEVGCKQPTVAAWEADDALPSTAIVRTVAKAYGLRPEMLLPEGAA
jgi:transcriptional regulator with XRE-family HTH domain